MVLSDFKFRTPFAKSMKSITSSCTLLTVHHLLTSLVHNWNWKPKHVYTCTQGFGAAFSGFNEIISLQIKATIRAVH